MSEESTKFPCALSIVIESAYGAASSGKKYTAMIEVSSVYLREVALSMSAVLASKIGVVEQAHGGFAEGRQSSTAFHLTFQIWDATSMIASSSSGCISTLLVGVKILNELAPYSDW